jgi:hypothetical protein
VGCAPKSLLSGTGWCMNDVSLSQVLVMQYTFFTPYALCCKKG